MTDRSNPAGTPALPILIAGLADVAHRYDGFIIDLWGTVHDGIRAYEAAIDVLRRLRAQGSAVCLLSNAPRSTAALALRLAGMGIGDDCYDHLLSSGQATIDALRDPDPWHAALGRTYYFMGPDDCSALLQGLGYAKVDDPGDAAFVLNTGTQPGTDLAHYEHVLRVCAARRLPMICANPDRLVKIGTRRILCAGTLARRYEALGGAVRYHGKPDPAIYRCCLQRMNQEAGTVLALGDGLETDIAGAHAAGIDAALVLGGLPSACLRDGEHPLPDRLQRLFDHSGQRPRYIIPYLRWRAPVRPRQ